MPSIPSKAVVDASVVIAVLNPHEEKHRVARELVEDAAVGRIELWAPMVLLVEVLKWAGAAEADDPLAARNMLDDWLAGDWLNLVEVDRRMAAIARDVFWTTSIKSGNDGLYVASAVIVGAPVIYSLDQKLIDVEFNGVVGAEPLGTPQPELDLRQPNPVERTLGRRSQPD